MHDQITEMLEAGIIRKSRSPYASPVVMVKKANGKLRLCCDYRGLNSITKKDSYPLPRIDNLMTAFQGSKLFTTLDMASGYHQIPMAEVDIEKTAFVTTYGLWKWEVLLFGLCTAPETYQKMVDHLIAGLKWKICVGYSVDIVVYSEDFEKHMDRLYTFFN